LLKPPVLGHHEIQKALVLGRSGRSYVRDHVPGIANAFFTAHYLSYVWIFARLGPNKFEKWLLGLAKKYQFNWVFIDVMRFNFEISHKVIRGLHDLGCKIVFLSFDNSSEQDVVQYHYQLGDAVICTEPYSMYHFETAGIPTVNYKPSYRLEDFQNSVDKDIDVSFVGWLKADRKQFLAFVERQGINVEVAGIGSAAGKLPFPEFSSLLARSKIGLNFTKTDHDPSTLQVNPGFVWRMMPKGRPVELALSRTFCLSEWCPEIGEIFDIGKEIDVFSTPEELVQKIEYYLANEKIREAMVERAFVRAVKEYRLPDAMTCAVVECVNRVRRSSDRGLLNRSGSYRVSTDFRMRLCFFYVSKTFKFLGRGRVLVSLQCLTRLGFQMLKGGPSLIIYMIYVSSAKTTWCFNEARGFLRVLCKPRF